VIGRYLERKKPAHRDHRRDAAALRSMNGSPPSPTQESGVDRRRVAAAVDVIAAVDAGVLQSLNQRIKQRSKE